MKTTIILFLLSVPVWAALAYVVFLIIKALRKYIRSEPLRQEKAEQAKTLGETLKRRRTACKMTQEFVAEALGVSRQAVCDNLTRTEALLRRMEENIGCVRRDRAVRKAAQEILAAAEKLEASQEPETVSLARQIMAAAQTLKE